MSTEETNEQEFDPADHNVDEVNQYIQENPDDLRRVLEAEKSGKNRTTLVSSLEGTAEEEGQELAPQPGDTKQTPYGEQRMSRQDSAQARYVDAQRQGEEARRAEVRRMKDEAAAQEDSD